MKFSISQPAFAAAIQIVGRVAVTKGTLPILSSVLLDARDGRLTLSATNLEVALQTSAEADVQQPGRICLPAKLLSDWVGLMPQLERITLSVDGKARATLTSGGTTTKLGAFEADDFPPLPVVEQAEQRITLTADALRPAIERVQHAIAKDDSRPVLAGMLFTIADGRLTLVTADGFRLALRSLPVEAEPCSVIVPRLAVGELVKLLIADDATVALTGTQLLVESGHTRLITRLIEGQFPDFARIIPREFVASVTVGTDALLTAVRAASLVAASQIIKLDIGPDGLEISSASAELGEHRATVPAETHGELRVAFNGQYLRDALTAAVADRVTLECAGSASPGILRASDARDGDIEILMPMHVADMAKEKAA